MQKGLLREMLAEFFGTFILIMFGVGVVAQVVLSKHGAGDTLSINIACGLLVVAIGTAFGFNAGYAINPARDFGPRLFTFVAGWGGEVFRAGNSWWWVPIVAPCVGAVLGGWAYDLFIGHRFQEG